MLDSDTGSHQILFHSDTGYHQLQLLSKSLLQRPCKEFVCTVKRNSQGGINRKGGRGEYKMIAAINENTGSTALILRGANLSSSHLSVWNAPLPCTFP